MTTDKQILANQCNAQLSTGPATPDGKICVSKNSFKHGVFSRDLILKSETYEESEFEYAELLAGLTESLAPQGQTEVLLVEKIAMDFWRLRRVIRFETGSIQKYLNEVFKDYYNPWRMGDKHLSAGEIDRKIEEKQSYIDWNKQYLEALTKKEVSFDAPLWKGEGIESDVEDDLYMIANQIDRKLLSESEKEKLKFGELRLFELKEIIARDGYVTDEQVTAKLIKLLTEQNEEYQQEIEELKRQKLANYVADELNTQLCSLPSNNDLDKILKYEKSIQKSIFQSIIMLKRLQDIA